MRKNAFGESETLIQAQTRARELEQKFRTIVNLQYPFFSPLLQRLEIELNDAFCKTLGTIACTDARKIYISSGLFRCKPQQQLGVLMHELLHVALMHNIRAKDFCAKEHEFRAYNIASDSIVNEIIEQKTEFTLPEHSVTKSVIEKAFGIEITDDDTSESITRKILEKIEGLKITITVSCDLMGGQDSKDNEQGSGSGDGDEDKREQDGNGAGRGNKKDGQKDEQSGSGEQGGESEEEDEGGDDGNGGANQESDLARKIRELLEGADKDIVPNTDARARQEITQALQEGVVYEKMRGIEKGGFSQIFEKLLKPELDWKRVLKKKLVEELDRFTRSYARIHKKRFVVLQRKVIPPAPTKIQKLLRIVVAIDTSGSMSEQELLRTLTEIYALLQQFKIDEMTVIQCDADIQKITKIKSKKDFEEIKEIKGRGGTAYAPVLEFLLDKKQNGRKNLLVYFTDGYGDQGDAEFQQLLKKFLRKNEVIWMITEKDKVKKIVKNKEITGV